MLRFESQGKLALRDRERLLSRSFLIALALALTLHLVGMLLFEIQPFRIGGEKRSFPPAFVDADLFIAEPLIVADLVTPEKKRRYLLLPPSSEPLIPSLPKPTFRYPFEREAAFSNPFFSTDVPGPKDPATRLTTYVHVSGPLSSLAVSHPPLKATTHGGFYLARYRVHVQQGSIFFIEPLETEGNPLFKSEADAILQSLTFEASDSIVTGMIEVQVAS